MTITSWLLSLDLALSYPGFTDDISSLERAMPIHNHLSMQVVLYTFEFFYGSNHELTIAVGYVEIIKDITTCKFLVHDLCYRRTMAFDLCWVQLWHDMSFLSFSCMKLVFHVNVHENIMRYFLDFLFIHSMAGSWSKTSFEGSSAGWSRVAYQSWHSSFWFYWKIGRTKRLRHPCWGSSRDP